LTKREISEQFAGGLLGSIWVVFHPLFLISVYIFVFGFVFQNRIGGTHELPFNYTVYILSGLIPWLNLQQVLSKSCTSIIANKNIVKQVIFPVELLPIKTVLATLPSQIFSLLALVIYVLATYKYLPSSFFLYPIVCFFQIIMFIGISFILSSTTVFLKDIKEIVNLFSFAGMFLLPIAYLPSWVPQIFKPFLYINPFSYMVWVFQDVFYFGRIEHPGSWIVFVLISVAVFVVGACVFKNLKAYFGDVM
jgi:lipopolysaccharide transport system permease protein